MTNATLKTNVVKRQVILADGTTLRNDQVPDGMTGAYKDAKGTICWVRHCGIPIPGVDKRMISRVRHFKAGKNIQHVCNHWTIGWCMVVADSKVTTAAARAAYKAVGKYVSHVDTPKAWAYTVDGVQCDVITEHGTNLQTAAEKGRKMADALLKYGITSRVYVMTDKQFGLGHVPSMQSDDKRRKQCAVLKGIEVVLEDKHPLLRTRWVLTKQQSIPTYQTSL